MNIRKFFIVLFLLFSLNTFAFTKEDATVLTEVLNVIKKAGANEKIKDKQLTEGMLKGLLQSVDPHSEYFTKEEYQKVQESISGKFFGIGIFIEIKDGVLYVSGVIDGMPAKKAGIKNGDYITHINEKSTFGLGLTEASNQLKGKKGTKVKIKVFRKDTKENLDFTVTRAEISVKSVAIKKIDNIAYINISYFTEDTYSEFIKSMKKQKNYDGIIIDLRYNPGGVLDSALALSSLFVNKGENIMQYASPIDSEKKVYQEKCIGEKKVCRNILFQSENGRIAIKNNEEPIFSSTPVVVLVNQYSASASEIFALALHENKKAITIGQKTFGKGSVQTVLPLKNGERGAIKLTTALYFSPNGNIVQANGLNPNIVIPEFEIKPIEKKAGFLPERESDYKNYIKLTNEENNENNTIPSNIEDFALQMAISSIKTSIVKNANNSK